MFNFFTFWTFYFLFFHLFVIFGHSEIHQFEDLYEIVGRCRLCKLNLGFCGHLRVVILEANYLNPSFCRVYYWWLGGFGMLIGAREG